MDNQHMMIKGYRDLSQEEIDLMNRIKVKAEEVGKLIYEMKELGQKHEAGLRAPSIDPRWLSIGKTDLQTGFMALTRAVAQPTSF